MSTYFRTNELALAAFLKARGHEPTLDEADSRGFVTFCFTDADGSLDRLASDFIRSAEVPALAFYHALNDLRGAIRLVRGGGR